MRRVLVVGAALVVAVPATVAFGGSSTDRATGGGQILIDMKDPGVGAGDTLGFTARGTSEEATGQLQYVDREGGTGQGQTTYHGTVECLDVMENMAKIAGTWKDGGNFNLYVADNGEGALDDDDMMFIDSAAADPTCDFDDPEEDDQEVLARGNAQVYDAP